MPISARLKSRLLRSCSAVCHVLVDHLWPALLFRLQASRLDLVSSWHRPWARFPSRSAPLLSSTVQPTPSHASQAP